MANEQDKQLPRDTAATEYKLVTTTSNGREQSDLIVDSDLTEATKQAWSVLQEKDQSGVQIEGAKLEWMSPEEGPLTEYFYDRQQGIEISRPEGIRLAYEEEVNRVRQPAFTAEELLEKSQAFTRQFGENVFHGPALAAALAATELTLESPQSEGGVRAAKAPEQTAVVEVNLPYDYAIDFD
jgi:hypothetical protein